MMKVIIDRIEDGIATVELENGKMINVPCELLQIAWRGMLLISPRMHKKPKKEQKKSEVN